MALIQTRLNIEATRTPGEHGQFDVLVNGEKVASRGGNWLTRRFGAGYPDLEALVEKLRARLVAR
ncbi:MAG TPA: hypothetical protein VMF66_09855 [Candidatus Acidoferrum sp.]|nr:hypothetical protein [Candidatus Acidoferrum sp.]